MGCYSLLQGIFPTQGSNLGLLHRRQIPYCLSHQGSFRCAEGSERNEFVSLLACWRGTHTREVELKKGGGQGHRGASFSVLPTLTPSTFRRSELSYRKPEFFLWLEEAGCLNHLIMRFHHSHDKYSLSSRCLGYTRGQNKDFHPSAAFTVMREDRIQTLKNKSVNYMVR